MKQSLIVLFLLGTSVANAPVVLADDPTGGYFDGINVECPNTPGGSGTTASESACYQEALQNAERESNKVYQGLMQQADDQEKQYLQNMQMAWIKLKDSQCGLVLYYYHDARLNNRFELHCQAAMTIRRVQELKQLGTGISWSKKPAPSE